MFYSSLTFENDVLYSRVGDHNIKVPLDVFARILHLSCEGPDMYDFDLEDFDYPENESPYTASHLLHDDDNPTLVKDEELNYYTIMAQVLSKIIFYNPLPKFGEYSNARGCAPLLI